MSTHPLSPRPFRAHSHTVDPQYREALERLFARTTSAWKLGLDRVLALSSQLGHPHRRYPVFHVAGTNGKGSTVATLCALLRHAGFRVGRYTSPHLVDFRERIVVDEDAIAPVDVIDWLNRWESTAVEIGATFFETTTVMAFDYFAAQRVDVAVVEVGLGGRLDATNIVEPVATGVTQIGLDHVEFLGHTLHDIAREKAGIFKAGVPAIIGDTDVEVNEQLAQLATAAGSSVVHRTGVDWQISDTKVDVAGTSFMLRSGTGAHARQSRLHTPLVGAFQAHNTAVALAMLRAAGPEWHGAAADAEHGLEEVRLAGRFHRHGRFVFDVAHNPDGARTLVTSVRLLDVPKPVSALVTVLRDKDWRGILSTLSEVAEVIVVSRAPTAPPSRAWSIGEVEAWAAESGIRVVAEPDFDRALDVAAHSGATVLVTGSFHTVGDAMERLQVDPMAR